VDHKARGGTREVSSEWLAGVFTSRAEAERLGGRLGSVGIPRNKITVLTPKDSEAEIQAARKRLEHQHLSALDAFSKGHLALAREQGYRAHLAEVRAYRVAVLLEFARRQVEFDLLGGFRGSRGIGDGDIFWPIHAVSPTRGRLRQSLWKGAQQFRNPARIASHSDLRLGSLAARVRVTRARLRHP